MRADRRHRGAGRGPRAGAGGRRRGEGGAAGDPAGRPRGAAGPGGRRGRRALPLRGSLRSRSEIVGLIRSASSARTKNSISSDMFACVMRRRSPSSAPAARSSSSSSSSTAACSKTPSRRDSHSGQRSTMRQCRGAFLGPVERVDELAGAVEADVQLLGRAGAVGGLRSARWRATSSCSPAGASARAVDVGALVGLHRLLTRFIDARRRRL